MRRDWLVRDSQTGEILTRATRLETNCKKLRIALALCSHSFHMLYAPLFSFVVLITKHKIRQLIEVVVFVVLA